MGQLHVKVKSFRLNLWDNTVNRDKTAEKIRCIKVKAVKLPCLLIQLFYDVVSVAEVL